MQINLLKLLALNLFCKFWAFWKEGLSDIYYRNPEVVFTKEGREQEGEVQREEEGEVQKEEENVQEEEQVYENVER